MPSDDTGTRVESLARRVADHIGAGKTLTSEQQVLAQRLLRVLPYLPRLKSASINVAQAEVALEALLATQASDDLARGIVEELEGRVAIFTSVWRSIVAGRTVASQVLLGILGYIVLAAALFLVLCAAIPGWRPWVPTAGTAPWIYLGGSLGGVMSVVIRLQDFALLSRWAPESDPRLLFYTGLLKPAAGVVFAFFAWAALRTGLVAITVTSTAVAPHELAFALAFVAGFSERFAPDIANRTFLPPNPDAT